MVLDVIPVIPPDLRPLVLLDSGNFATSDLNDLYRRIINRNNRLKKLVDLNAPEVIVRNEKRMLQQSVDALFDNNRCKRPVLGSSNRPLKSLTDMIKGKQGRFRENLLGKRVDYSARSVIVVGPELKLHQCGLPKKIALELFQPFVIRRLKDLNHADTIKSAKRMLERRDEEVWDILDEVITNHPVLLNRAPTLHRMGIQAFEPVLIEGNAIKIHPLVCKGFNADFDGDQMAVHLPLSIEAQVEATTLMMSTNNIFSPANGQPIISASQDIVMGCAYLTLKRPDRQGEGMIFTSPAECFMAFAQGKVGRHAIIKVRLPKDKTVKGEGAEDYKPSKLITTTVGRVMFNDVLHPQMAFYNLTMKGRDLANVISDCYQLLGRKATIELLDNMKELGFHQATESGMSFAASDLKTAPNKDKVIGEAEGAVLKQQKLFERGIITNQERYNQVLDTWTHARELITKSMMHELEHDYRDSGHYVNPLFLMANSGARGGVEQMRQLAGMRGLMAKPSGEIIETPIKANFREGLTVLEYFSSTHGARKGLADTALKTADSGYLTRKLADICQNMVITTYDCGTTKGITRGVVYRGEKVEVSLADAIRGRVSRTNIVNPITDEVIVREDDLVTIDIARKIEDLGLEKIQVRSPMTCEAQLGICRLCYGMDLSTGNLVEEGLAVGIIAAQSIGEPGTQLTMRTFHIGGAASREVEENEIRTRRAGRVRYARIRSVVNQEGKNVVLTRNGEIIILDPKERELEKYTVPNGATLMVAEDEEVEVGRVLCQWDPHSVPILAEVGGKVRFEDCIEGAFDPLRARGVGQPAADRHRAQGRSAPADHPRRLGRQDSRLLLPARAGHDRRPGRTADHGRLDPGQEPPRSHRHAGHRRWSAPRHRAVRGPQAQGPGHHRRDRRRGGTGRREEARQAGHHRPRRRRDRGRAHHSARQAAVGARQRPRSRGRRSRPRAARAARHPAGQRCRGRAAVPVARNPERVPFAAGRNRRQAHRDRRLADAPETARRRRGRLDHAAGGRARQVRVPQGQRGVDGVREDHRSGQHRIPDRRHRPGDARSRRSTRRSRRPTKSRPSRPARGPRPPAFSCWASRRRPCRAKASSRRPASRRRPRCSPKRPWPARSTISSASRKT